MNPRLRKVTCNRGQFLRAGRPQSPLPRGPQPGGISRSQRGNPQLRCHHQRL